MGKSHGFSCCWECPNCLLLQGKFSLLWVGGGGVHLEHPPPPACEIALRLSFAQIRAYVSTDSLTLQTVLFSIYHLSIYQFIISIFNLILIFRSNQWSSCTLSLLLGDWTLKQMWCWTLHEPETFKTHNAILLLVSFYSLSQPCFLWFNKKSGNTLPPYTIPQPLGPWVRLCKSLFLLNCTLVLDVIDVTYHTFSLPDVVLHIILTANIV